jgi:hypothetical protein
MKTTIIRTISKLNKDSYYIPISKDDLTILEAKHKDKVKITVEKLE